MLLKDFGKKLARLYLEWPYAESMVLKGTLALCVFGRPTNLAGADVTWRVKFAALFLESVSNSSF